MKIHCPHCLAETELEHSVADSVIRCAACGSVFDPRKKETLPNAGAAGAPAELLPGIAAGDGFGGYVLERRLGKGGMGIVFEATQTSLGRKVALKVLAHDLLKDPEFVRRFDREARVLAQLSHPNIVQVIDKGIERGNVFLVMEMVEGVSLRDLISEKKIPPADALKLIPQLCDALEYAHSRGVVHRDIKPDNILVARDGQVKIADFGLARIVGEGPSGRITKSNAVMGSLDYMAPEQREKTKDADHRADIYALGVVFYELLTGELPIGRFEPPSKKVKLEVDVDEVVLRILSKDPEMRYQRASDVGAELRRRSGMQGAAAAAAADAAVPAGGGAPVGAHHLAHDAQTAIAELVDRIAAQPLEHRIPKTIALGVVPLVIGVQAFIHGSGVLGFLAGLAAGAAGVFAIGTRVVPRIAWRPGWGTNVDPEKPRKRYEWPRPYGALAVFVFLVLIFLPTPLDKILIGLLAAFAAAVHTQSPRLFTKEVSDMPYVPSSPSLPRDLAHLGHTAPAAPFAPAAPPRPRMSILALLGFLAACVAVIPTTFAAAYTGFIHDQGFAALDDFLTDASIRHGIEGVVSGVVNPGEASAVLLAFTTFAGIAGLLLLAFNAAVFFSVGRKAGLRGAGFAFVGGLLTVVALLGVGKTSGAWKHSIDRMRPAAIVDGRVLVGQLAEAERDVAVKAELEKKLLEMPREWNRLERALIVAELQRTGPAAMPLVARIAKDDPSPAVRYAAAYGLGRAAGLPDASTKEKARAALEGLKGDPSAAVQEAVKWGLADPATRGELTPEPAPRRARVKFKQGEKSPISELEAEQGEF
jgi:predicted Ser/Thr protein kinase